MKDSTFWEITVPRVMSIYANAIFLLLWVGFAVALIANREWLDTVWEWVQSMPLEQRIPVWLIFLPILVGLWIWQSSWSTFGRVAGFAGIIAWTIVAITSLIKNFR